ncbi:hypothetical protein VPH35_117202 [Triticum aestivum]
MRPFPAINGEVNGRGLGWSSSGVTLHFLFSSFFYKSFFLQMGMGRGLLAELMAIDGRLQRPHTCHHASATSSGAAGHAPTPPLPPEPLPSPSPAPALAAHRSPATEAVLPSDPRSSLLPHVQIADNTPLPCHILFGQPQ